MIKAARHTYWCRWEAPGDIPDEHMVEKWPKGMRGWISGYSKNATIWCARVDATSPEAAERIIRKCYGPSGDEIQLSWEPEENKLGWRPTGGRFPE